MRVMRGFTSVAPPPAPAAAPRPAAAGVTAPARPPAAIEERAAAGRIAAALPGTGLARARPLREDDLVEQICDRGADHGGADDDHRIRGPGNRSRFHMRA